MGRHVPRKEFLRSRVSPSPAALARLAIFMCWHCHDRSGEGEELGKLYFRFRQYNIPAAPRISRTHVEGSGIG